MALDAVSPATDKVFHLPLPPTAPQSQKRPGERIWRSLSPQVPNRPQADSPPSRPRRRLYGESISSPEASDVLAPPAVNVVAESTDSVPPPQMFVNSKDGTPLLSPRPAETGDQHNFLPVPNKFHNNPGQRQASCSPARSTSADSLPSPSTGSWTQGHKESSNETPSPAKNRLSAPNTFASETRRRLDCESSSLALPLPAPPRFGARPARNRRGSDAHTASPRLSGPSCNPSSNDGAEAVVCGTKLSVPSPPERRAASRDGGRPSPLLLSPQQTPQRPTSAPGEDSRKVDRSPLRRCALTAPEQSAAAEKTTRGRPLQDPCSTATSSLHSDVGTLSREMVVDPCKIGRAASTEPASPRGRARGDSFSDVRELDEADSRPRPDKQTAWDCCGQAATSGLTDAKAVSGDTTCDFGDANGKKGQEPDGRSRSNGYCDGTCESEARREEFRVHDTLRRSSEAWEDKLDRSLAFLDAIREDAETSPGKNLLRRRSTKKLERRLTKKLKRSSSVEAQMNRCTGFAAQRASTLSSYEGRDDKMILDETDLFEAIIDNGKDARLYMGDFVELYKICRRSGLDDHLASCITQRALEGDAERMDVPPHTLPLLGEMLRKLTHSEHLFSVELAKARQVLQAAAKECPDAADWDEEAVVTRQVFAKIIKLIACFLRVDFVLVVVHFQWSATGYFDMPEALFQDVLASCMKVKIPSGAFELGSNSFSRLIHQCDLVDFSGRVGLSLAAWGLIFQETLLKMPKLLESRAQKAPAHLKEPLERAAAEVGENENRPLTLTTKTEFTVLLVEMYRALPRIPERHSPLQLAVWMVRRARSSEGLAKP